MDLSWQPLAERSDRRTGRMPQMLRQWARPDVTRPDVIQRILAHVAKQQGPPALRVGIDSHGLY